jgi:hypothetical protein
MIRKLTTILAAAALMALMAVPALAQEYPPPTTQPTVGATTTTTTPGGTITIVGEGFQPGTTVTATLGGQVVGTTQVLADGTFRLDATIPANLAPGTYTITVAGTGADGQPASFDVQVTVAAPGAVVPAPGLAATGGSVSVSALLAIALLLVGGFALLGARARARATADA